MKVLNICYFSQTNAKTVVAPVSYFPIDGDIINLPFYNSQEADTIIFSGGFLLSKFFKPAVENVFANQAKNHVAWGVGIDDDIVTGVPNYPSWLDKCKIVGIRDYIQFKNYYWTPCVSCMNRVFDKKYDIQYEIVIYEHHHRPIEIDLNAPRKKNNIRTIEEAVEFLGSGAKIITNSYYGVYWGLLLERQVYCYKPWSKKFLYLNFNPIYIDEHDWQDKIKENSGLGMYENLLYKCRLTNRRFFDVLRESRLLP
jgi:hypothetical protein